MVGLRVARHAAHPSRRARPVFVFLPRIEGYAPLIEGTRLRGRTHGVGGRRATPAPHVTTSRARSRSASSSTTGALEFIALHRRYVRRLSAFASHQRALRSSSRGRRARLPTLAGAFPILAICASSATAACRRRHATLAEGLEMAEPRRRAERRDRSARHQGAHRGARRPRGGLSRGSPRARFGVASRTSSGGRRSTRGSRCAELELGLGNAAERSCSSTSSIRAAATARAARDARPHRCRVAPRRARARAAAALARFAAWAPISARRSSSGC